MDHAEAIATHATDRYLLGELTAAEADSFEEHFFDCAECADELRVGMRFLNGGRGLARETAAPAAAPVVPIAERRAKRTVWIPAAIAAALVLAIGAPLLMQRNAPSFEVASHHSFLLADSRGAGDIDIPTFDGNAPIVLWVDVPAQSGMVRYEARLHRPDGSILTLSLSPDPNGEPKPLTVRGLSAGRHDLVIEGIDPAGRHAEISRNRFIVRR